MQPPELLISTPAQVRALASPVRTAIIESLLVLGPSTIKSIAARLGRSPESLYHHARILEAAGLIRVHAVRPTAKTRHTVYALVSTRLRLDRSKTSAAMRRARAAAIASMLASTTRRARAAATQGLDEHATAKRLRVETVIVPLDQAALAELHARIDALWAFLRTNTNPDAPPTALTIALTPASAPK